MANPIVIKGVKQGVLVHMNEQEEWNSLLGILCEQIDQRGAFFKGAQWVIDLESRLVTQEILVDLRNLLEERQVQLIALLSTNEGTIAAAQALDILTDMDAIPVPTRAAAGGKENNETTEEESYALPPMNSEEYGTSGVLIKRTLRSGRTVRSLGHVVVIGDVNSGAEIVAVGDIIVWGKVRGVVHAGVQGDENAVVCALDLAPTQLRIASLITVPPEDKRRVSRPEMARVNNGQIEAIPWV